MKRFLTFIFALILVFTLLPSAWADDEPDFTVEHGQELQFSLNANGYDLPGYWEVSDESIISAYNTQNSMTIINGYVYLSTAVTVSGNKVGTATLYYKSASGSTIRTALVEVVPNECDKNGHKATTVKGTEPTCTESGLTDGEECSVCGETFKVQETIPAKGHSMKKTAAKAATCTEEGNVEYYSCSTCGKTFSDENGTNEIEKNSWIIPKIDHTYREWTVEKEATEKENGKKVRVCTVCGNKEEEVIPAVSHGTNCPSSVYKDVAKDQKHWTHLPIDYVLGHGYMAGVSSSSFEPNSKVSRAMVVQVLYAMEGKPGVEKNAGFKDVKQAAWYSNAVNWAASKGIVAGYTNGKFGVNDPVIRQDLVAIMYKYANYKKFNSDTKGDISKFVDKDSISKYAVNGMKWAVGNNIISGIVKGSKSYAEPKATATRAQLAVILKAFDSNVKK